MGIYVEESKEINLSKQRCEEILLKFDKKEYDLRKHESAEKESQIVFHTKAVFSSKGQRITIWIEEETYERMHVKVKSEIISNIQIKDQGINQRNISNIFNTLENEDCLLIKKENGKKLESVSKRKNFFSVRESKDKCEMRTMVTYLGGYHDQDKALKGNLEIYSTGFTFSVLGPKFSISKDQVQKVEILSNAMINQEYRELKEFIPKEERQESEKRDKIIICYDYQETRKQCVFRSDNQLNREEIVLKIKKHIEG
jgi:hypothetical protein